ncbi:hypothetical protein DINM_005644 [Dirofilaria immitis]|nr:hypothetical protein [Dirofilaria immitis]
MRTINTSGDVFAEPQWLPAQSDCQIYCPMAKGLCLIYVNLSANGARIHKQKCLPVNCANELQRFLVTVFTNTTPSATTDIAIINATVTYNNTIKYHKGLNKTWNEMHERIRPDHGDNGITDATFQPAPGMWVGRRRLGIQFKRKFHDNTKFITNEEEAILL